MKSIEGLKDMPPQQSRSTAPSVAAASSHMLSALLGMLMASCTVGVLGEPYGAGELPPDVTYEVPAQDQLTCDPTATPAPDTTRRLSHVQLDHAIRDLLAWALPSSGMSTYQEVQSTIAGYPLDLPTEQFDYVRMQQSTSQTHADRLYNVVAALGAAMTNSTGRLGELLGACATDSDTSNDLSCVRDFVRGFGRMAFRRSLVSAEETLFFDIYGTPTSISAEDLAQTISSMLVSPSFLFVVEDAMDPDPTNPSRAPLGGTELATRLALLFWDSIPDEPLLAAGESGELLTDTGFNTQLGRITSDPRTKDSYRQFLEQWLQLDHMPDLTTNISQANFQAFAGSDLPGPNTREHAIEDTLDLMDYLVWEENATVSDLFTTRASTAKTQDIADLYGGVPLWTPGTTPPMLGPDREGVLTRVGFLIKSSSWKTAPILRGATIYKRVLGRNLAPPPDLDLAEIEFGTGLKTTRQEVEELTEQPGTSCAGCHQIINKPAWIFGGFDALGRTRTTDDRYDAAGNVVASLALDTTATPEGLTSPISTVEEINDWFIQSGELPVSLAKHYFRFAMGRSQDLVGDGCLLVELHDAFATGTLQDAYMSIVHSERFHHKQLAP